VYEKYSVLFVDDEVNILNSLQRGLMDEEYKCYFASSGKEALKLLEKTKISVIVSDMRMPEMDGLKLLKEVEDQYPRMIKIVLSGYTQLPQILVTINQVDIFKFITKPWKLEGEFKVVIHKALDYYIMQEENDEIKKALQNKNLAYTNILKNIEDTVASAKKSSEILAECGKQIIDFNRKTSNQSKEVYTSFIDLQGKVFDLFIQAVKGDEKETSCEALFNEVIQVIETYIPISNTELKTSFRQKAKIYYKIAVALLLSCTLILEDLYNKNGLYIVAAVNNTNNPTISLICPKVSLNQSEDADKEGLLLDIRMDLLNSVIANVAKLSKMDFYVTQLNGSLIAVLTLSLQQE
jgi:YesN/AraC family two-component response regulator